MVYIDRKMQLLEIKRNISLGQMQWGISLLSCEELWNIDNNDNKYNINRALIPNSPKALYKKLHENHLQQ